MSDRGQQGIEASLRRQFEPPNLDALGDRVAAASVRPNEPAVGVVRLIARDDGAEEPNTSVHRRRTSIGVLVAVAAQAATVLLLARPSEPGRAPVARESKPAKVRAPTSHEVAGRQLHDFLRSAAYQRGPLPDGASCIADGAPIPDGVREPGVPLLQSSPDLRVVWECGGATGIDCAAHDLPAQRMMVVQLMPAGPNVIVCIEPPWADPEPKLPADSVYNIFRRTLGGYVLYEVTPLDTPRAVDSITI